MQTRKRTLPGGSLGNLRIIEIDQPASSFHIQTGAKRDVPHSSLDNYVRKN